MIRLRGSDGLVEIDTRTRTVAKTYIHPDHATAAANARREVAYATRFREALAGRDDVACPRIFGCEFDAQPRVHMELCPGSNLSEYLLRHAADGARLAPLAGRIRHGLEVYTRLFGEPYWDFCFNNMLYDPDSGRLTLIDFVQAPRPQGDPGDTPVEASLGWLAGCACYTLARPSSLLVRKAAYRGLLQAVLGEFAASARPRHVHALAEASYAQMRGVGGGLRRAYYRSIGALVTRGDFERMRPSAAP